MVIKSPVDHTGTSPCQTGILKGRCCNSQQLLRDLLYLVKEDRQTREIHQTTRSTSSLFVISVTVLSNHQRSLDQCVGIQRLLTMTALRARDDPTLHNPNAESPPALPATLAPAPTMTPTTAETSASEACDTHLALSHAAGDGRSRCDYC